MQDKSQKPLTVLKYIVLTILSGHISRKKLSIYKVDDFRDEQFYPLYDAITKGLTYEQLLLVANKDYSYLSMTYLIGLINLSNRIEEDHLTMEQLRVIANPEFTIYQMENIIKGFRKYKISINQAKVYADSRFDVDQMKTILTSFALVPEDTVKIYALPSLTSCQMNSIIRALNYIKEYPDKLSKTSLTIDRIKRFAVINYDSFQMDEIYKCLKNIPNLSHEKLEMMYDYHFCPGQLKQIRYGFESGLSFEQVELYAYHDMNSTCMEIIRNGLMNKSIADKVYIYAKQCYDATQMEEIKKGLEQGYPINIINIYADPKFDSRQMKELRIAISLRIPINIIKNIANPEISFSKMHTMITTEYSKLVREFLNS